MDELLSLAQKLAGAGFATLLLLILEGSRRNIWVWGRDVDKLAERYEALVVKEKEQAAREREQTEFWRSIAMRATGIAEMQGTVAATLAKKTAADTEH